MTGNANRSAPFAVRVSREGATVTAAVAGELDLASNSQLEASLVPPEPGDRLVLDLRELTFIDSSGIRLFMELDIRSRLEGWTLVIVRGSGAVQRVLDLCKVSERILTVDDPADAG